MARYPVIGATAGEVDIPDQPSGSATGPQWDWRMRYFWTQGYSQTMPVGYGNDVPYGRGINLQKGVAYPPGYRVANGQPGGGYAPSGAVAKGTEPIKLQPPPKGVGRMKFWCTVQIWVKNTHASQTGSFVMGLGVSDINGPDFPMHPWHGVGHYLEMGQMPAQTVRAGDTVIATLSRFDMVDNDFHEVPGWPNWEMTPNPDNKLWPAVTPMFQNRGATELAVVGFWGISYPTL